MSDPYRTLRSKLDAVHTWPGPYTFKFIVPSEKLAEVEALFAGWEFSRRSSRNGRYVGLTCEREMASSDEVIDVYRLVEGCEGTYAL